MDLPISVSMRTVSHGHGAKGYAFYGYESVEAAGVRMEARRKDGRSPFIETWFYDGLPDRGFPSYAKLREAVLPLSEAEVEAATTGAYPQIKAVYRDTCGNRCRLCPRTGPPDELSQPDTWRVELAFSWKDVTSLSLCDNHTEIFRPDPKGLSEAFWKDVAERKARGTVFRQSLQEREVGGDEDYPF